MVRISGEQVESTFAGESGGHRIQQVSGNGKKSKVHSSTVTVAVLPEPTKSQFSVLERDLHWQACCAGGPGGQSVNTAKSAVQLTHIPSGLMVRSETERSQLRNRELVLALLTSRLWRQEQDRSHRLAAEDRRGQVGSGMRSDKAWTVRFQDGIVTRHSDGKKFRLRDYLQGDWE